MHTHIVFYFKNIFAERFFVLNILENIIRQIPLNVKDMILNIIFIDRYRSAITKFCGLGGLNNRNLFSYSSRG